MAGKFILVVDGVKESEQRGIELVAGTNVTLTVTETEGDHVLPSVEIAATGGGVTDHGALTGLLDDDHTLYRLESADHTHQSTGLQAGQLDHGLALAGLTDDDHTQYILKALVDAKGDLIAATAADTPARLAIGARGSSLFANSAASTGLAWVQASYQAEAYGAVGDDSTDNQAAVQAAIDDAATNGGGFVDFGEGVFRFTTAVTVKSNVYLRGSGIGTTELKSNASGVNVVALDDTASNMGLFDLTVNGNRTNFAGSASAVVCAGDADDVYIARVRIKDPQSFGLFLDTTTPGGYNRIHVLDCEFVGSASTNDLFGSGGITGLVLTGCIFRDGSGQGFATTDSDNLTITDNYFTNVGNGISLEPAQNATISNNTFYNLKDGSVGTWAKPVAAVTGVDPSNITITGNRFFNIGTVAATLFDHGIIVDNGSDVLIANNLVSRMGRTGIRIRCTSITGSANTVRNVSLGANEVIDSNQDNAAGIGNSSGISFENNAPGTFEKVRADHNKCIKIGTDSNLTHGIRETGAVNGAEYLFNDARGAATAAVTTDTGTGSVVFGNSSTSALVYPDHGVLSGRADDDHTQYILHAIADAQGDILLASGADTFTRLAIGGADTILTSNGTTASWQTAGAASHPGFISHSRWETD